jgi:DNA-binding protein HU-beta
LNKTSLIDKVAETTGLSKKDSIIAVESTLDAITEALAVGDSVKLIGFGTFSVLETAERNGVNPATGEKLVIKAGKKPKFKAGDKLKQSVQ